MDAETIEKVNLDFYPTEEAANDSKLDQNEEEPPLTSSPGSLDDKDMRATVEDTQPPNEADNEEVLKPIVSSEAVGVSNSSFKEQSSSDLELGDDIKDLPLDTNEDDSSVPEGQHQTQHEGEGEKKTSIDMGLNISSGESGCSLDVGERSTSEGEEPDNESPEQVLRRKNASPRKERSVMQLSSSDEEERHFKHKNLKVIIEESLSEAGRLDSLEEQESHFDDQLCHEKSSDQQESENTSMLDNVSLEFEHCTGTRTLINLQSTSKLHRDSDVDEDSGNDHRSCGEHTEEVEHIKADHEQDQLQSVAERISKLEKQVADSSQQKNSLLVRHPSKKEASVISDVAPPPTVLCTGAALQSSLSFSYDCSGVITKEPEGRKVQSIKEMFMAKSVADIQYGQKRFPSPNTSELSDYRTETSDSGGYQSQSSDLSSGDDDLSMRSIAKGLVMRTIEKLYGDFKKDTSTNDAHGERPSSALKQKTSSIFSKVMSDLSYLSSTSSEAPRCITMHAGQVGPADVKIDEKKWPAKENQIRKSISEPVCINKAYGEPPQDEEANSDNTKDKDTNSHFNTKSDSEDKDKSKCIYFSVRQASDSDAQGDQNSTNVVDSGPQSKEESEEARTWAERNGSLPHGDYKMGDNKVHPLVDGPTDDQVIVKQPKKGHGVIRPQEPDMLDILYNFCGQNCPIL